MLKETDIKWTDPAAISRGSKYDEIFKILENHPDRWAEIERKDKPKEAYSASAHIRNTFGGRFEIVSRTVTEDGNEFGVIYARRMTDKEIEEAERIAAKIAEEEAEAEDDEDEDEDGDEDEDEDEDYDDDEDDDEDDD